MSTDSASRLNPATPAPNSRARPDANPSISSDGGAGLFGLAATRPENELLLACASVVTGAASKAERVRELARAELDWDYLFRLARRHAVLPLLYRGLGEEARGAAPRPFLEALREKVRENAARATLLSGELARIAARFESERVPALAYKGPALALQAYGEVSLRRFVDLDLVVDARDAGRACELLSSLGYSRPTRLTKSHEEFLLRRQHAVGYTRDGGEMLVELHRAVSPAAFADFKVDGRVWERADSVLMFGRAVRCLSPEDTLLALCVHGTKHLWERLSMVCDVAALVNARPGLDWPYVLTRADESRGGRMLSVGLRLAAELLGARLPEALPAGRGGREERALAAEVVGAMFGGAEYEPAGLLRGVRFNLRARPRLREKLDYLRFILTPTDGDLSAARFPPSLSFLYYLLRPLRLALKREADV